MRRMLSVLAAIDTLPIATLMTIVARTGLDKKTITRMVEQAREQAGLDIEKLGPVYRIKSWGNILRREGAIQCLEAETIRTSEQNASFDYN